MKRRIILDIQENNLMLVTIEMNLGGNIVEISGQAKYGAPLEEVEAMILQRFRSNLDEAIKANKEEQERIAKHR